jgi:hypothetical protein
MTDLSRDRYDLRWSTKAMDVLTYTCEFTGTVVANDIAFHLGMSVDAVRVQVSRLRQQGLVEGGSPYKATAEGHALYGAVMKAEEIDVTPLDERDLLTDEIPDSDGGASS